MIEKENVLKFMQYIEKLAKVYEFNIPCGSYDIYAFAKDLLDWLEKQSEQKLQSKSALKAIKEEKVDNANKVEPEFKVGDWITFYGGNPYKILKIEEEINGVLEYLLLDQNGHDFYFSKAHVDKNVRLWTIQDAKDGDVLIDKSHIGECVFIFKEARASDIKTDVNNPLAIIGYCGINHIGFTSQLSGLGFGDTVNCTYYPATKEQRDLLFQKMKEAGYEWDADKKELKKLVVFGCKAPNRFDPKTLKEFDKVLVKDDGDWIWRVDIISVPAKYNDNIPYLIGDNDFDWIIPYNEDTKHLIGTSDDAPEYYKYWED